MHPSQGIFITCTYRVPIPKFLFIVFMFTVVLTSPPPHSPTPIWINFWVASSQILRPPFGQHPSYSMIWCQKHVRSETGSLVAGNCKPASTQSLIYAAWWEETGFLCFTFWNVTVWCSFTEKLREYHHMVLSGVNHLAWSCCHTVKCNGNQHSPR